ncbi:hypothetical protein PG990_004383 [Apiospora arundinis]|uniref:Uncharacterized protein n=1 Tax=Apiospora arundinis TaxID=335852 RepID=A0ABR2J5K0_9PEZI
MQHQLAYLGLEERFLLRQEPNDSTADTWVDLLNPHLPDT